MPALVLCVAQPLPKPLAFPKVLCPGAAAVPPQKPHESLLPPVDLPEGDGVETLLAAPHLTNRLKIVMAHTYRYAFEGQARLAADVSVSRSTITRLIQGRTKPPASLLRKVTEAISIALDRPVTARNLFSPDGTYPTRSGCWLCGCNGCLPEYAYDRFGKRKAEYALMEPGDWTVAPLSSAPLTRT